MTGGALSHRRQVAVLPAGIWATALSIVLADNGHRVCMWHRDPNVVETINEQHVNPRRLPGVQLPAGITATSSLEQAVRDASVMVLAPASQGFRDLVTRIAPYCREGQLFLSATKGIEPGSMKRMTELLLQAVPVAADHTAALSGPNFASEVARRLPTSTVIASRDRHTAETLQTLFFNNHFRVYINPDIVGVELAGSLKNILAIAVGAATGMNLGYNAGAALITRGITELTRLGLKLGAHPLTFAGLAGLGDIVLTCTSDLSRNRRTGILLGRGQKLGEILQETGMTVEGVHTTRAAYRLATELRCEVPIVEQTYHVLYDDKPLGEAVESLMGRTQKHEIEQAFLEGLTGIGHPRW